MLSSQDLDQIEELAMEFRERMGVPDDDKIDMVDILRRMKFAGQITNVVYKPVSVLGASIAQFDPASDTIMVSEESANRQSARDRFTYAHEIGHKIGNHTQMRHRKMGKQFGGQVGRDEEYANAFAAALLVPEHLANVTEQTTTEDIVRRFGVSSAMAKFRLLELQRRSRIKNGVRRAPPSSASTREFDTGDYDAAMAEMSSNSRRWN